ncbi:sulfotransferase family protein [Rhizohabitans arisaemae]|uniref:sulfotransferase family protein n=1 Tax=Rhizohabitans arisaemae TaxID=2720610 RepID=UPI003D161B98
MLHSHPRIAVPPETRFLVPAYYKRRQYGDLRVPENRYRLAKWITSGKDTKFRELRLDADEIIDEIMAGPPSLGSAIGIVFRSYAERFGKPRWGDKRPSYFHHVGMLQRLFPDAQFVNIVRDGRDCVASLKEMPWYRKSVYHAAANWAEAVDYAERHARRLPADTFYQLRYENLTADPEAELRGLCEFLGEEYDPVMCEPRHIAGEAVPKHKVWHKNTHGDVTQARVGSWQDRLEPWEVALCEAVLGDRLLTNGYQLSGAPRPAAGRLAKYEKIAAKRRFGKWKKLSRDRIGRLREPSPVGALLTSGQRLAAGVPLEPAPQYAQIGA